MSSVSCSKHHFHVSYFMGPGEFYQCRQLPWVESRVLGPRSASTHSAVRGGFCFLSSRPVGTPSSLNRSAFGGKRRQCCRRLLCRAKESWSLLQGKERRRLLKWSCGRGSRSSFVARYGEKIPLVRPFSDLRRDHFSSLETWTRIVFILHRRHLSVAPNGTCSH